MLRSQRRETTISPSRLGGLPRSPRREHYTGSMPIYEYACMECERHFDELVRSEGQVVDLPRVRRCEVVKQLSTFAVVGASSKSSFGPGSGGGGCCGGSCGC